MPIRTRTGRYRNTGSNELTIVDCAADPFNPRKQPKRIYRLWDAHGVEWDAKRNCLWGLGKDRIVKYAWHADRFELEVLTEYLYGVSPEKAKFPKRDRPVRPEIQSLEMTVKYPIFANR